MTRLSELPKGYIICAACGIATKRRGQRSQYCLKCSESKDLERKRLWARENPQDPGQRKEAVRRRRAVLKQQGIELNSARSIAWMADDPPDLLWSVRVGVPFDFSISKNHAWTTTRKGHVHLGQEHRDARNTLRDRIALALVGVPVVRAKVWLDILVQMEAHKGDAVNVIDGVCDAVKEAVGVDDRWFAIRRLDWEIVKQNPQLFVGIGQDTDVAHLVCGTCGGIKPEDAFGRNRSTGIKRSFRARVCLDCSRVQDKSRRSSAPPARRKEGHDG